MGNDTQGTKLGDVRLGLPTVAMLLALVGAGAFAAGRAAPPVGATSSSTMQVSPTSAELLPETEEEPENAALPPGHPAIDTTDPASAIVAAPPAAGSASLVWKVPPRWRPAPNTSNMRLATYRVPRVPGDTADAELSIAQAGGSAEANTQRWIGQFDEEAQKTAKRTARKVGSLDVLVVEVRGTFSGGMSIQGEAQPGWALLGAIVSTPGMPHFFKLTGPAKTVAAARAEFDGMLSSLSVR